MIEKNYFDKYWNSTGGYRNKYKLISIEGIDLVRDDTAQLMWFQSGSMDFLTLHEAKAWIAELNEIKYAEFSDWRLPTLEEALTLMENERLNGSQYIDPLFDTWQWCIHTGDIIDDSHNWLVAFSGRVDWADSNVRMNYARPVRSLLRNE